MDRGDLNSNTKKPVILSCMVDDLNWKDAIRTMATYLEEKQFVKPGYVDAVISREKVYPTGIPSEPYGVAIPHSERGDVLSPAILIGKVKNKGLFFNRIDDPESQVEVKIIFMLAENSNQGQLELISSLMECIQDEERISKILNSRTKEEIIINAKKHLFND